MNDLADRFQQLAAQLGANPPVSPPKVLVGKAKATIGRALPPEYLAWMLYCGECNLDQLDLEFITISHPPDSQLRDVCTDLPMLLELGIPIAHDFFGNYFVLLDCHVRRPVVFVEGTSAYEANCVVASSLERFLAMVCESNAARDSNWWLNKAFLLKHDPELASFSDIPFSWEGEK